MSLIQSDLHHNAGVNSSATAVDVALVVGGESAARQVPTLVKSIFYNPIFGRHCKDLPPTFRFHIICSASACRSLTVLFETWRISGLEKVYFHYMENYVVDLHINQHSVPSCSWYIVYINLAFTPNFPLQKRMRNHPKLRLV